jgi:uncharacterized protein (TIGR02453 family)
MCEVLPVFGPEVFSWFEGLERDNSRDYFARTRKLYEREVRGGLEALLEALGGEVKVFRQQRDLRFSRDKRPYKDRTYGIAGRYYVQLSARGLYAGTGMYQPSPEQLERYREAVDADDELERILSGADLEVEGASVKTAPRGWPRDHPRIELLRRKMLIVGRSLPPGPEGIPFERALEHARGVQRAAQPVLDWLDARVYGSG